MEIFKEMSIPDHLTASCKTCMQIKKQQLEPDMKQCAGFKFGEVCVKGVYCHPACLTYTQSTSCETPGQMMHKLESSVPGEISGTSDMQITPSL